MVEQDCDPRRLPTTLENLCKLHIFNAALADMCACSHSDMMHTGSHTHTHTRVGAKHIFKLGWSPSSPGTLGGWSGGPSMVPLPFPSRKAGAALESGKKEGGKEEALALCIVPCQEDEMASERK